MLDSALPNRPDPEAHENRDEKQKRLIADFNAAGAHVDRAALLRVKLGHHRFSRTVRKDCERVLGQEQTEQCLLAFKEFGGTSLDQTLRALRLCCLGFIPRLAALKACLEEEQGTAGSKAFMPGRQGKVMQTPLLAAAEAAGQFHFAYSAAQLAALRAPLDRLFAHRDAARPGEPGALSAYDAPTGMGKSFMTAQALADRVEETIRLHRQGLLPRRRVIMVVAPMHSLVAGPADDLERELKKRQVDPRLFTLVRLVGLQRHAQRPENKRTGNAAGQLDGIVPDGCPGMPDFRRKAKDVHRLLTALASENEPDPRRVHSSLSHEIDAVCSKHASDHTKLHGCLPSACRSCAFWNPGEAAYGLDGPPVRVVFLTYHKLFHGLRRMAAVRATAKNGSEQCSVTFSRLTVSEQMGAGATETFTDTSFIFEECVQGFQVLWSLALEGQCRVDVFLLLEHLLSRRHLFEGAAEDYRSEVQRLSAKGLIRPADAQAMADQLGSRVADLTSALTAEMKRGFYVHHQGGRLHVHEKLNTGLCRTMHVCADNRGKTVMQLIETTDMALSGLAKSDHAYYATGQVSDSRVVMRLGTKAELGLAARKAGVPLRTVPHYVLSFMVKVLELRDRLNAANEAIGAPIHAAMVERLKRGTSREMGNAIDLFLQAAARTTRRSAADAGLAGEDTPSRFRRSGYRLVHLQHQESSQQYDVLVEAVPFTPDGLVEKLLEAGNDVMLMSATATYDNPIETFSVPYLARHHDMLCVPGDERGRVAEAIRAKYARRSELGINQIAVNLTKRKDAHNWRAAEPGAWHSKVAAFAAACPEILSFEGDQTYKDGSHLDAVLSLLSDILAHPDDPRFAVVVVNSHQQARDILRVIEEFEAVLDTPRPALKGWTLSSRDLEGPATLADAEKVQGVLASIQGEFKASLLSDGRPMAAIVIAPYQTVGVGVNLQTRISRTELPRDGALPRNLARYVGETRTLSTFGPEAPIEIDVSDTVLALPKSKVVNDENKVWQLLTMEADSRSDPALLGRTLGLDIKELVARLKRTDEYATSILMGVIQAVGRGDRSLNNPARQQLWLHQGITEFIARLPQDVYEGANRPLLTPSQHRMIEACREGRATAWGHWQFPGSEADARMKGVVAAFCDGFGPGAAGQARKLWELLKIVGAQHQVASDAFFAMPLAQEFDRRLERLRDECRDPGAVPASIADLYMAVPRRGVREVYLDATAFGRRADPEIVVRGCSASVLGDDWFASLASDLPPEVRREANPGRWVGRDAVFDPSTGCMASSGLGQMVGDNGAGTLHLFRSRIMRDIGHPFTDEARTARALARLGTRPAQLPDWLYEAADHLTQDPPCAFNNKTFHRGYFSGADGADLLMRMVDKARSDLARIAAGSAPGSAVPNASPM